MFFFLLLFCPPPPFSFTVLPGSSKGLSRAKPANSHSRDESLRSVMSVCGEDPIMALLQHILQKDRSGRARGSEPFKKRVSRVGLALRSGAAAAAAAAAAELRFTKVFAQPEASWKATPTQQLACVLEGSESCQIH